MERKSIYNEELLNICFITDTVDQGLKSQFELLFTNCKFDVICTLLEDFGKDKDISNYDIIVYSSSYGNSIWASEKVKNMTIDASSKYNKRVVSGYMYYDTSKKNTYERKMDIVSSMCGYQDFFQSTPIIECSYSNINFLEELICICNSKKVGFSKIKRTNDN